jgi:hypothetical protein
VIYGDIPVPLRIQPSFIGAHSMYVDAFRPAGIEGEAAYYVMDPIGRTWAGYRGAWLPADAVERFATKFGGGRVLTSWAFPGGVVPADHPILPPGAFPSDNGRPPPSTTPRPSDEPADPLPSGDLPPPPDPPVGDPPGDVPHFPDIDIATDVSEVREPGIAICLAQPPPARCPRGIRGLVDVGAATPAIATGQPAAGVRVLYANPLAPGTYQLIIEAPPDTAPGLWFWTAAGDLHRAKVEAAELEGKPVSVATITVDPTSDFSFLATASGDGIRAVGSVGSLDVKS